MHTPTLVLARTYISFTPSPTLHGVLIVRKMMRSAGTQPLSSATNQRTHKPRTERIIPPPFLPPDFWAYLELIWQYADKFCDLVEYLPPTYILGAFQLPRISTALLKVLAE